MKRPICNPDERLRAGRVIVLLYHRVARLWSDPWGLCVRPNRFLEQMQVLRRRADVVKLSRATELLRMGNAGRDSVAITFDDGYADNLHAALPVLARYQLPATIFVATDLIGRRMEMWSDELERILLQPNQLPVCIRLAIGGTEHEWHLGAAARYSHLEWARHRHWWACDAQKPTPRHAMFCELWELLHPCPASEQQRVLAELRRHAHLSTTGRRSHRWLTAEELRRLASSPHIEIGGHTVTHPSLGAHSADVQRDEIINGKAQLESLINHSVTSFAYPYGARRDFNADTIRILAEAGFDRACSNDGVIEPRPFAPFDVPRVVVQDWSAGEFARRLDAWLTPDLKSDRRAA